MAPDTLSKPRAAFSLRGGGQPLLQQRGFTSSTHARLRRCRRHEDLESRTSGTFRERPARSKAAVNARRARSKPHAATIARWLQSAAF